VRRKAAFLRHNDKLAKASVTLSGRTKKAQVVTGVFSAPTALVAPMAGYSRVDYHLLADLDASDGFADGLYRCGALVTYYERILHNLRADSAGLVVVHIRAANANHFDFKKDVAILFYFWLRHIHHLHLANAGQYSRFHITTPIQASPYRRRLNL
jgi:hypothetical protein